MRLPSCDVYIEAWGPCEISCPVCCYHASVAVDRDQARDVALFLNFSDKSGDEQVVCKLSYLTDFDSSHVLQGSLALRFSNPQILVQVSTPVTKGLKSLSDLILKLTSARKLGKIIRFRANHNFVKFTSADSRSPTDRLPARAMHGGQDGINPGEQESSNARNFVDDTDARPKTTLDTKADVPTTEDLYDVDPYREIENWRKAFEQESNRRKRLEDKIERIEQEQSYLNTQIKIEQRGKSDLIQKCSSIKEHLSEVQHRLNIKEIELQKRTEELIEARSCQQDVMEEEIERLRDVERVTNTARAKQNRYLSSLLNVLVLRRQEQSRRTHFESWKMFVRSISKRLTFLKLVSKHCFWHCVGKMFILWKSHISLLNDLRVGLDRFLFKQCKSRVRLVFHLWFRGAASCKQARVAAQAAESAVKCEKLGARERCLVEQVDSTLELMEAAENKHTRKQEELKGLNMQLRADMRALEARLAEAQAERRRLEQRIAEAADLPAQLGEARGRAVEMEAEARRLAEELRRAREDHRAGLAVQRQLENVAAARAEEAIAQERRARELEERVVSAEVEAARSASRAEACAAHAATADEARAAEASARVSAEGAANRARAEAEAARRDAQSFGMLQERLEEEEARRRAVEDALGKLVAAFREQKLDNRRRLHDSSSRMRLLQALCRWLRAAGRAGRERAAERVRAVERECGTQLAALEEEGGALAACMQQLTALRLAADAAAGREAALEAARARAEAALAEMKTRYLEGVKSSVETIRLCRDRYLASGPPPGGAETRGEGGSAAQGE